MPKNECKSFVGFLSEELGVKQIRRGAIFLHLLVILAIFRNARPVFMSFSNQYQVVLVFLRFGWLGFQ